eukprot:353600-Chlamydomonas_euryale.AAC.7
MYVNICVRLRLAYPYLHTLRATLGRGRAGGDHPRAEDLMRVVQARGMGYALSTNDEIATAQVREPGDALLKSRSLSSAPPATRS